MTRYAIYFSPAPDSLWWDAGCRWLGRDASSGIEFEQGQVPGLPPLLLAKLTADARRYGFHATLKAPFRLAGGGAASHLAALATEFAAAQRPIVLEGLQVRPIGDFLALRPSGPGAEIGALATRCVAYFDALRAAPTDAELARRRHAGLNARQEWLLQRWGYPYTEEQFRFHLTLSDGLSGVSAGSVCLLRQAAEQRFAAAGAGAPLVIDALTICREEGPGAAFAIWRRFPFGAAVMPAATGHAPVGEISH